MNRTLQSFFTCTLLLCSLVAFAQYQVGDKAMDFKLKNVDDKMISLSDFSTAKGFIVIFTQPLSVC